MIQSVEDVVEPRLRAAGILAAGETVWGIQGAYTGTVSASGGTHDAGGALDHAKGSDAETIIWRECGWADWQRGDPHDPHFDDHNHGIVIGCPHLSPAAADQVHDYHAEPRRNGLADGGPDQSPYVPYITWQDAYDKYAGEAMPQHLYVNKPPADRTLDPGDVGSVQWGGGNTGSSFPTYSLKIPAAGMVTVMGRIGLSHRPDWLDVAIYQPAEPHYEKVRSLGGAVDVADMGRGVYQLYAQGSVDAGDLVRLDVRGGEDGTVILDGAGILSVMLWAAK